eukprot:14319068-Alexandrium_andersonii.AAC.1
MLPAIRSCNMSTCKHLRTRAHAHALAQTSAHLAAICSVEKDCVPDSRPWISSHLGTSLHHCTRACNVLVSASA